MLKKFTVVVSNLHLTNFSDDKKAYPVYMILGNIQLDLRRKHSKIAVV